MADLDIRQTTGTELDSNVDDFKVSSEILDEESTQEVKWVNPYFSEYLGYYKTIPELKKAVDALAYWVAGKGFEADTRTTNMLRLINGWGEDSFQSILQNMITMKKINGDAFAEIIRDKTNKNLIINLKPLNPSGIQIVVNKKGIIVRYEELNPKGKVIRKYKPEDILHLSNDRVGNEIHGVSVVESCKWVIDARNEAMSDWRRISHRATIRVLYVDEDDKARLANLKSDYATAINKGELMILPARKEDASFEDLTLPPHRAFLDWIQYLEGFFYQAVGIPKIILGGSQEFTEASSKIGYLTFEQVYATEQKLLEDDLFAQLGIEITFNRPVSLKDDVTESEEKNTGQVGFQQNETTPQVTRNE